MADSTAKNASAKKSTAKRSTARTGSGKKPAAKKSAARKSAAKNATKSSPTSSTAERSTAQKTGSGHRRGTAARAEAPPSGGADSGDQRRSRGSRVARAAREAVLELTGKRAESVTGLERTDDGWTVEVEVLELERIPNTTDVLATYQVILDDDGELQGCHRVHRYLRGSAGDD
jgi:hypothetical protein